MLRIFLVVIIAVALSSTIFEGLALAAGKGPAPATASAPTAGGASAAVAVIPNPVTGGFSGVIHTRRPTLYIISLAPDLATGAAIAVETAMYLSHYRTQSGYVPLDPNYKPFYQQICTPERASSASACYPQYGVGTGGVAKSSPPPGSAELDPWFIPEPTWSVQDYVNQCLADPADTIGSIVITAIENDSGTRNFVVWADNYSRLYADAFFVTCEPHSADEYEAVGVGPAAKSPLSPSNPLAPAGTRLVSQQETQISQGKSWQMTLTVAPSPSPAGEHVRSLTSTTSWANSRPAVTNTTATTYAPVPIPTPTPNMSVIWDARSNLYGHATGGLYGGGVPLLTIAGVASYYAGRTKTVTTYAPAGCTGNNGASPCTQTQTTSPTISPAFALLATSISGLGSINVPGANPTSVLKRAASNLSQSIYYQLRDDCGRSIMGQDQDMEWMCMHVFNFTLAPSSQLPSK